jgi:peptidoglycan-N-acetylglucosamine deacetylase
MKKLFAGLMIIFISLAAHAQIVKQPIPDKLIVFTFDDATASQYSIVAPLLKQYGFGATFYICEFPPNFSDTSKYMNWRQIRELDKMGFEIANHTRNHPGLTKLKPFQILDQLRYIDRKCDSMKIPIPVTFAYPGYDLDSAILELLKIKNYLFVRAGGDRPYDPLADNPYLVPSWAMTASNKQQIMDALLQAHDGKIVVLTIHGVPDSEHPWVTTPPELFKEYLQFLSENHYKVISMKDLQHYINSAEALQDMKPDFHKKLGKLNYK